MREYFLFTDSRERWEKIQKDKKKWTIQLEKRQKTWTNIIAERVSDGN